MTTTTPTLTPVAAAGHANYRGDRSGAVGQLMGPNLLGEYLTVVTADYDPATDRTRARVRLRPAVGTMTPTIQMVPVDLIDPHPHNPRRDLGDLTELAVSIGSQGIQQNLVLVPKPCCGSAFVGAGGVACREHGSINWRYTAVIGHRRLAAAKLAGLTEIPAVVNPTLTDAQQLEIMLLENCQRTNLSPVEEADGYQQLLDLGVTVAKIAKQTGRSAATVRARVALLALPEQARERVHAGQASLEDAAKLHVLEDRPDLYAKAAAFLGTSNFGWQVSDATSTRARDISRAPLIARLAELGVARITDDEKHHSDSVAQAGTLTELEEAIAELGDLANIRYSTPDWDNRIFLRRLKVVDETAAAARKMDREAEDAERARKIAEAEALQAHRDEWVRAYAARKRIPAKDQLAILAAVGPLVLARAITNSNWQVDNWLRRSAQRTYPDTPELLNLIGEHLPGVDPACCLLIALHITAGALYADDYRWLTSRTLYALLEALGYPVSDAERARITPPTSDAAEA